MDPKNIRLDMDAIIKQYKEMSSNVMGASNYSADNPLRNEIPSSLSNSTLKYLMGYRGKLDFLRFNYSDFGSNFLPKLADALQTSQSDFLSAITDVAYIFPQLGILMSLIQSVVETVLYFNEKEVEFNKTFYGAVSSSGFFTGKYSSSEIVDSMNKMRGMVSSFGNSHEDFYSGLESYARSGGMFNIESDINTFQKKVESDLILPASVMGRHFNKDFNEMSSILGDYSYTMGINLSLSDLRGLHQKVSVVTKKNEYLDSVLDVVKSHTALNSSLGDVGEAVNMILMTHQSKSQGYKSVADFLKAKEDSAKFSYLLSNVPKSEAGRAVIDDIVSSLDAQLKSNNMGELENYNLGIAISILKKLRSGSVNIGEANYLKDFLALDKNFIKLAMEAIKNSGIEKNHYLLVKELFGLDYYMLQAIDFKKSNEEKIKTEVDTMSDFMQQSINMNMSLKSSVELFQEKYDELKIAFLFPAMKSMFDAIRDAFLYMSNSALLKKFIPDIGISTGKDIPYLNDAGLSMLDNELVKYTVDNSVNIDPNSKYSRLANLDYKLNKDYYDSKKYDIDEVDRLGNASSKTSIVDIDALRIAYEEYHESLQMVADFVKSDMKTSPTGFSLTKVTVDR